MVVVVVVVVEEVVLSEVVVVFFPPSVSDAAEPATAMLKTIAIASVAERIFLNILFLLKQNFHIGFIVAKHETSN